MRSWLPGVLLAAVGGLAPAALAEAQPAMGTRTATHAPSARMPEATPPYPSPPPLDAGTSPPAPEVPDHALTADTRADAPPVVRTTTTTTRAGAATETPEARATLAVALELRAELLDHALPRHPTDVGQSHLGTLIAPTLRWRPLAALTVEAGARVRVPMSLDLDEELGALPLVSLSIRLTGDERLTLTLGSLPYTHGFHPAVAHEARLAYGRDVAAAYDRPLAPAGRRALPGDPRVPGAHGARLVLDLAPVWVDAFLDWQLLETPEHREKFVVGALSELRGARGALGLEVLLDHYGGERYTRSDPRRAAGLDPTRQDLVLAGVGRWQALRWDPLALELHGLVLAARPLRVEGWRTGLELGADVEAWSMLRIGYRYWRTLGADAAGDLGEAGDPTYRQVETHRGRLALTQAFGPLGLETRFDLVFPIGRDAVQYELSTRAVFRWDWTIIPLSGRAEFE